MNTTIVIPGMVTPINSLLVVTYREMSFRSFIFFSVIGATMLESCTKGESAAVLY